VSALSTVLRTIVDCNACVVLSWIFLAHVAELVVFNQLEAVCPSVCMCVCVLTRVALIITATVETCIPAWGSGNAPKTTSPDILLRGGGRWTFHCQKLTLCEDYPKLSPLIFPGALPPDIPRWKINFPGEKCPLLGNFPLTFPAIQFPQMSAEPSVTAHVWTVC